MYKTQRCHYGREWFESNYSKSKIVFSLSRINQSTVVWDEFEDNIIISLSMVSWYSSRPLKSKSQSVTSVKLQILFPVAGLEITEGLLHCSLNSFIRFQFQKCGSDI